MHKVEIRKVDGQLIMPLTPELLSDLGIKAMEGDILYLNPTGTGELKMQIQDPETARLIAAEQSVMEKNHEILAGLA